MMIFLLKTTIWCWRNVDFIIKRWGNSVSDLLSCRAMWVKIMNCVLKTRNCALKTEELLQRTGRRGEDGDLWCDFRLIFTTTSYSIDFHDFRLISDWFSPFSIDVRLIFHFSGCYGEPIFNRFFGAISKEESWFPIEESWFAPSGILISCWKIYVWFYNTNRRGSGLPDYHAAVVPDTFHVRNIHRHFAAGIWFFIKTMILFTLKMMYLLFKMMNFLIPNDDLNTNFQVCFGFQTVALVVTLAAAALDGWKIRCVSIYIWMKIICG